VNRGENFDGLHFNNHLIFHDKLGPETGDDADPELVDRRGGGGHRECLERSVARFAAENPLRLIQPALPAWGDAHVDSRRAAFRSFAGLKFPESQVAVQDTDQGRLKVAGDISCEFQTPLFRARCGGRRRPAQS
jgi:hypothetical protein